MKSAGPLSLAAALAVALGGIGFYANRVAAEQNRELQELQRTSAQLRNDLEIARQQKESIARDLRAAQDDLGKIAASAKPVSGLEDAMQSTETDAWTLRLKQLRTLFERDTAQRIPEMAELGEDDWLSLSRTAHLDDDKGIRQALAAVRSAAKMKVGPRLNLALMNYLKGHSGIPPASGADLANLVSPPLDAAVFDRYAFTKLGDENQPLWRQWQFEEKTAIDATYDSRLTVSPMGVAMRTWITPEKAAAH